MYNPTVPGRIPKLNHTVNNTTTIILEWEPPNVTNGVIRGYNVCYWILNSEEMCKNITSETEENTRYDITNLSEYIEG